MAIAHALTDTTGDVHAPGTSITITKPTGAGASHILIAVFGSGRISNPCGGFSAATNWTLVNQIRNQGGTGGQISVDVYWSLGDNTNLAFSKSGIVDDAGWVCLAFTGCDLTTPIDATGTPNGNSSAASLTTNAVTIATDQAWHLIGFGDWLGKVPYAATGFTERHNGATNEAAALLYNTTPKGVGSTGTVSVSNSDGTTSGEILAGVPFALRPAAAAGGVNGEVWRLRPSPSPLTPYWEVF